MASGGLSNSYIMVIETSDYLHRLEANQFNLFTQKLHSGFSNLLRKFDGQVKSRNDNTYIVEFDSVTNAILCALKIQSNFKYITPKFDKSIRNLNIGICHSQQDRDPVQLATWICEVVRDQIVITPEVKKAYQKENRNIFINREHIRTLNDSETQFLVRLMSYIQNVWRDPDFSVVGFSEPLKYSNSQVYRKMMSLTGMHPSAFIKNYRLHKAINMLHNREGNITEIAGHTGFNSAAYFSKCFFDKYNILPSKYMQQHIA